MSTTIKSLYEKYKQDIYIYLISLTHDQSAAEDLTSEVFVSAIKSLPNFQGKSEIKTWLFSIARHKWYEYLRKEKKNTAISTHLEEGWSCYIQDEACLPEKNIISAEIIERIKNLLANEKEQSRKITLMRVDGYSFLEIAKKFNISESSARVIDFRIRKKLKEVLTKEGFFYE